MEKMTMREAAVVLAVVVVGAAIQLAFDVLLFRPIVLAIFGLLLLAFVAVVRGRRS